MKICMVGGYAPSLLNFRGPLLKALVSRGYYVTAVAPRCTCLSAVEKSLSAIGVGFRSVPFSRAGVNPLVDLWSFLCLVQTLLDVKPDYVLAYTVKPVIYVGLALRMFRLMSLRGNSLRGAALITGLGYAFSPSADSPCLRRSLLRVLLHFLYRESLKAYRVVIFQNPDDQRDFELSRLTSCSSRTVRVWGSGVDLDSFTPSPVPDCHSFLMLARLITDKGVREYVHAARIVRVRYPQAVFRLAGPLDSNPAAISRTELDDWISEGVIQYLGELQSVHSAIENCRYYVLPSYYREGVPRSILEAMAMARPVITTDSPGCRETVIDGENGFLVPPRDPEALSGVMFRLIEQSSAQTHRMAHVSLALARERFDVCKVNEQMLSAMQL